ncbi:D-arginine dehydrogenase [Sphingomonas naasensis]|uniref:FAD-binding oxidoreductase n=1 Tax=Sphingomonas naasensis TaxID=1344951 RepID=A0A4S1WN24_9SPHN|nr:FAD-dependent oxidoreductase [Sphingomonas naasensis]NIJ21007.1 D-arginine dehydrogenase [Sphingomonas naasensis]TGX43387.1 FAD-binding oxidoreductase [Sphingomonas naasensis]
MNRYDVAIVGAGIAGASLAAELAPHLRVLLLEAEERPGYHATGRSAAFWSETYGGPDIQPLTTASGPLLRAGGFLEPLGSLHIGRAGERAQIDALLAKFEGTGVALRAVDPREALPGLRPEWTLGVYEPSCEYIDVGGLHAACLAAARRAGSTLVVSAALAAAHREAGLWRLDTRAGAFEADILVNAAGAWADPVAALAGAAPLGIQPYRRTMLQLRTEPAPPPRCPHVAHIGGSFYFKPEAGGRLWLSPHDEIASPPCDAAPEEIDVAIAIDRFEQAVDWRVAALEHKWAGLRSFAPDRLPVYGFDPQVENFFWCAGQGGFGIQTAPAAAKLAAALLLRRSPGVEVAQIDAERYSPRRF